MTQALQSAMKLFQAGSFDRAGDVLRRALRKEAKHPGVNQLYAMNLHAQGQIDGALLYIQRAIDAQPGHAEFYANLAVIKSSTPDREGTERALRRALHLDPAHADAGVMLAALLAELGAYDEAERLAGEGLARDPSREKSGAVLAKVLSETGRPEEAAAVLDKVLTARSERGIEPATLSLRCMLCNYTEADPPAILEVHRGFGRRLSELVGTLTRPTKGKGAARARLRVGYLSPDLRRHSVTAFFEPILEHHDRTRFEVFCYSTGGHVDETTRRLERLVEHWRPAWPTPDGQLLDIIRRDEIDILVELSGHGAQNRLPMLAARATPVQVTFLGYPATSGAPGVDVRLVDRTTDPDGMDQFATERLVRLPGCFLCYRPPEDAPAPETHEHRPVTFGSFNNPAKLSRATLDLWGRVLCECPHAVMILKGAALGVQSVRERYHRLFEERGVEPSRVELVGRVGNPRDHLRAYARMDIALDPIPYNGTTTTCEALWMGVPVVTLEGRAHAARVGASLLRAAGAPELVATSADEYIQLAAQLAGDVARRREYRRTFREQVARSPLCDAAAYIASFEEALRGIWDHHVNRETNGT